MAFLMALLLALPGWEGKVRFRHDPPRKSGGSDGAIHAAEGRVRLEEQTPMGLVVILWDGRSLRMLLPERKEWFELRRENAPLSTAPPLDLRGMVKAGAEAVDGQACTIYERKAGGKVPVTQRLWVPDAAREKKIILFLREVTLTPRGGTQADVSDVRVADQPAALFQVPKDYRRAGATSR